MPLFEMTSDVLEPVPSTTFAAAQVLERTDLQRLLRARIDMIVDGVMVVAEEFGAFADARRRIDLLGVDRAGQLVVIELKRTTDGGHLELQALRYAAMVSVMTFDDLSHTTRITLPRSSRVRSTKPGPGWPTSSRMRGAKTPY